MKNLKHLKTYNERNTELDHTFDQKQAVFVTEHLLKIFYNQRKKLSSKFKQAGEAGEKTRWVSQMDNIAYSYL